MSGAVEKEASCPPLGRASATVPTRIFPTRIFVSGQSYGYAVVVFGEAGFGELKFQFGQYVGGGENRFGVLSDLACHLEQDAMDFGLFLIQQADQFVVLF